MISHTTKKFRKALQKLPPRIQRQAKEAYELWREDPHHRSLQFKRVHPSEPIYSVRVAIGWRALGIRIEDIMIWYWIGSHADYDNLISQL
ncbi:MAG: type II toxin-antitoxin system RelE family toxin [Pyrinomonadaceae bacterium]